MQLIVQFLTASIVNPNRNDIINRFCSVAAPIAFLLGGLSVLFSERIQETIWNNEKKHQGRRLKIRPYCMIRIIITLSFVLSSMCYFYIWACYPEAIFCTLIMIGYIFIKVDSVFSKTVCFTKKYMTYCSWGKKYKVALRDIYNMHWENPRNGFGYILVFSFPGVPRVDISTEDFYGLRQLKEAYDQQKGK